MNSRKNYISSMKSIMDQCIPYCGSPRRQIGKIRRNAENYICFQEQNEMMDLYLALRRHNVKTKGTSGSHFSVRCFKKELVMVVEIVTD